MLRMRLAEGMPIANLGSEAIEQIKKDGLAESQNQNLVLTLHGRLLADRVIDKLTD
jgi:coproporphyrinogen III oxidase-like Fe-S oxidoreductase